ncbi:heparinase II/III domain-containing protein [Methylobacterium sp. SyP6R]|uniref:heparinase II/III domain-containing protein n=1 Tax=Methylobacterium sp. SyP6R TaxID=2718876 RepID=UPI001F1B73A6|nr:heparinase II/III family protein [Methylobacterium sp. SyP6R]MCF4129724.1 heparinase II/III-family protein [Methylobacterium sp. SyP6R]
MLPALLPSEPVFLPVQARYAGGAGPGTREGEHAITANNRWSRVQLTFRHLPAEAWCCLEATLAWTAEEEGGQALDFLLAGFDFLAADGSSLDVEQVPGLVRTLLDPHSAWIAGPACQPAGSELVRMAPLRVAFGVPPQARGLALTLRSWRNSEGVTLAEPRLRPGMPSRPGAFRRRRLGPHPEPLRHGLVPGLGLVVRGQIHAARQTEHAARVSLVYRDRDGAEIPPPYPGTVAVPGLGAKPGAEEPGEGERPALGAAINLPAQPQARRFTLALEPPPGATALDLGFCTWEEEGERLPAVELLGPPEVALEDRFRLESLCGDDLLDAPGFLARLSARLGRDPGAEAAWIPGPGEAGAAALPLARARSLRSETERPVALRQEGGLTLRLAGCPDWTLPEPPDFREDPFRAVPSRAIPWRLAYQSLTWLLALAEAAPARALALAQAWSRANPWGQPADPLSLHPGALPARAEVWIGLLALPGAGAAAPVLTGEAVRHGFALAEIVGQNTFGRSLHQLQAAAALLALASALPRLPFSGHWDGLARESLRDGVPALLPVDGHFSDSSLHRRLDLVTLGRALREPLGEAAPGPLVAARTEAALSDLAGLLDPGGRLPPFGEVFAGTDDAGWIARLRGKAGLVAQRPTAQQAASSSTLLPDGLCARHDTAGRGWAHFACTFAETSPQGHADCTSFVYAAGATRWIVEAGGSEQVEIGAARHYLLSSRAHNVAVIDGTEPVAGRGLHRGSLALPGAVAHAIETNVHGPGVRHLRVFVLPHDLSGLAVIDRFAAQDGGPLTFRAFAQLAPETLVAIEGPRRVQARQGGRRLGLVPFAIAGRVAGLDTVIGRSERPGTMQGFVVRPGVLEPACTLRYAVTGRGTVCGGLLMAVDGPAEDSLARVLAREELAQFLMQA